MGGRLSWRRLVPTAALVLVAVGAASSGHASSGTAVGVAVTPAASVADAPIHIAVRGLSAAQLATVRVNSVDAFKISWASSATFRANHAGKIDVDRVAPVTGSYRGVWGMGLIAMMASTKADRFEGYVWNEARLQSFRVTVRSHNRVVASTSFRRRGVSDAVQVEHESPSEHGFYGDYYAPAHQSGRHPAILAFGGSEGGNFGMSRIGKLLAGHGYPTLNIAYFREPGLPQTLSNIPLEYFAKAIEWLRQQPGVDASRIVAFGVSRGSEAAQLLGVYYPDLVHGVIAGVPSSVAVCSYPTCDGPAWTFNGSAIPYTRQFDTPNPTDNPAAAIHVERIRGPIFLTCAGRDTVWTSCPYAAAIMQRLNANHDRYTHLLYQYLNADHQVGFTPYEPQVGNDPLTEKTRERVWTHLLAFLQALPHTPH